MLSMADCGRPKILCINMTLPLGPMASPWQASLHKSPMAVVKKIATPFGHFTTPPKSYQPIVLNYWAE